MPLVTAFDLDDMVSVKPSFNDTFPGNYPIGRITATRTSISYGIDVDGYADPQDFDGEYLEAV